jgi:HEAT repeat protein
VLLGCVLLPGLRSQTAPAKSVGELFDELSPDMIHESRRQERLLQQFLDQRGDALTFLANELKHVTHPESSTNVDRRVKATRLLKEFNPPAPEAVPVLVKALEDQSDVRRYAAYSLSDMGPLPEFHPDFIH